MMIRSTSSGVRPATLVRYVGRFEVTGTVITACVTVRQVSSASVFNLAEHGLISGGCIPSVENDAHLAITG
jgi:hypothetical protein